MGLFSSTIATSSDGGISASQSLLSQDWCLWLVAKESGKGGKFKCAKDAYCTNDCSEGFINYESCDNCRNKEEVCAEHNEEDEDCDEDEE